MTLRADQVPVARAAGASPVVGAGLEDDASCRAVAIARSAPPGRRRAYPAAAGVAHAGPCPRGCRCPGPPCHAADAAPPVSSPTRPRPRAEGAAAGSPKTSRRARAARHRLRVALDGGEARQESRGARVLRLRGSWHEMASREQRCRCRPLGRRADHADGDARRARLRVAERITDLIGDTPHRAPARVREERPGVEIWAKCEF